MPPVNVSTADTATAAANTAVVVTLPATNGLQRVLKRIDAAYSGAPTGGQVQIEAGAGNIVRVLPVTAAGTTSFDFGDGLKFANNQAVIITLAAGGAGVTGRLNVTQYGG